jgi:hypothetical protein
MRQAVPSSPNEPPLKPASLIALNWRPGLEPG